MRKTVTIDDDLYALLEELARREHRSVGEVANDALRAALTAPPATPYRVRVHHSALQPGIDPRRLNQLVDEVDDDEAIQRLTR